MGTTPRSYAANAGWIGLENAHQFLRLESISAAEDSDHDSLPDPWEIQHASNLQLLSGARDSDNDGQSDRDEYLAGTNPLAANDFLGPVVLTVDLDTSVKILHWPSKANHVYRVEQRNSLDSSGVWSLAYNPQLIGTGGPLSISLGGDPDDSRIYRVTAFPPLTAFR